MAQGTAVCGIAAAMIMAGGGPAVAAGAQHFEESVVGDVFVCEDNTYTVTDGTLKSVFHEGQSKSGNTNFTGTLTPRHVVLEDAAGSVYRVSGAVWFGETTNSQQESAHGTFTAHLNIVEPGGGVVDRVAQTGHFSSDGNEFFLDQGTCELPDD